jgi:hypothetical protein
MLTAVRKLLQSFPFLAVILMFWACGRQSACERELARMQKAPPAKVCVEITRRLATMPTTEPVSFCTGDEDD